MAPPPGGLPCPWQPCRDTKRHHHPYIPARGGQRQCSCGNRTWQVTTGGPLPVLVSCARCGNGSRLNTLYEAGRERGRQEVRGAPAA
jgi:hypothetical protein